MRRLCLLAALISATACDDARRPGGTSPTPVARDGGALDAAGSDGAADALPAPDVDPRADALPDTGADALPDTGTDALPDTGLDAGTPDADPSADATPALDAQPLPDAQTPPDAQAFPDAQPVDAGPPSNAAVALASARALPNGPANVLVDGAVVTFVRTQALGNDLPGFVIQADRTGPALWIAVDPATLAPPPAVGDRVSLVITAVGSNTTTIRLATTIAGYTRQASGVSLAPYVQEVSQTSDLVSALTDYEAELVRASGTVSSGFRPAGSLFVTARVETAAVIGEPNLELRLPTTVNEIVGLGFGCSFTVQNPLWRFEARAQLQAFSAGELTAVTCPPVRLVTAAASSPTRVLLAFDRPVAASSVLSNGSQFTFSNGLVATGARVVGGNVIVSTTTQQALAGYSVTVSGTVQDVRGGAVDPNFRTASFSGSPPTALVRVNEVNANIAGGCDLVELRVERGGSMDGWVLRNRDLVLATFTGLSVIANQYVVVHATGASATCNPLGVSGGEVVSPTDQPRATFPTNFDGAFDWYSTQGGIVNTDTVLALYDGNGNIVDAVLVSDDPTGTTANASEDAAQLVAAVGEWTTPQGTVPSGGFVDDTFCAAAVAGLDLTGTDATGNTLQRTSNADTNTALDWTSSGPATWGALNPGQSPF